VFVRKICWSLLCLLLLVLLAACNSPRAFPSNSVTSNSLNHGDSQQTALQPTPTPPLSIPSQQAIPTPAPAPARGAAVAPGAAPTTTSSCVTYSNEATRVPAKNGSLAAPYGSAPVTGEAQQLAQQLLQLINQDRAACGLPSFAWDSTLASGAALHSWNMIHCGFSHTCPDGSQPCQRIANEGFAGLSDCGENIGEAGPYPTPWGGTAKIQASMENEPLGGWHRIHLFSTTLHRIGIGVVIDSSGYIWFTEDMVS